MGFKRKIVVSLGLLFLSVGAGLYSQVRAQEKTSNLTGQSQIDWVVEQTAVCEKIYFEIKDMLEKAKTERDIAKITHLNNILTQVAVNLKGVESHTRLHEAAVVGGQKSTADYQFALLKIYVARILSLRAEAENFFGEVDIVLGDTTTILTVDGDFVERAGQDPFEENTRDNLGVAQPPLASGFF
jgi:hypothetical protein